MTIARWAAASLVLAIAGCDPPVTPPPAEEAATDYRAVNIGGPSLQAVDGTRFEADIGVSGGDTGRLETVRGVQDPALFGSYREGDLRIDRAMADGVYDLTFLFAEPGDVQRGERVFDVIAEDAVVLTDIDIMLFRDGRTHSGLTVTAPGVRVADGALNIRFAAAAGEPVLSGLIVRPSPTPGAGRPVNRWQLAWADEFDVDGPPDPARWTPDVWPPGKVNDEDQAYTARNRNLRVEDGVLVIEAHREDLDGARYTSGRIHSAGKGDILYGRVEVRAQLPRGQGTWPAIWMLPTDPFRYATTCEPGTDWQGSGDCDAWPNSGEIDIMEHVGYQMNHVHATVHTKAYYWRTWEQRKGRVVLDDVAGDFHDYAIEWSPERIDMFVDDIHYFSYVNEGAGWEEWPFDAPFNLILNVAVGGAWGRAGGPIDDSIFPQRMHVDYVRVYEQRPR